MKTTPIYPIINLTQQIISNSIVWSLFFFLFCIVSFFNLFQTKKIVKYYSADSSAKK